jgi:hypothetical protein
MVYAADWECGNCDRCLTFDCHRRQSWTLNVSSTIAMPRKALSKVIQCCSIYNCKVSVLVQTAIRKRTLGRPKRDNAPVPAPTMSKLPLQTKKKKKAKRSAVTKNEWRDSCAYRANLWFNSAPRYRLPVRLSELAKRPKNKHVDEAYEKMEEMEDWPADACSGLWYDEDDKLLVAYIAHDIVPVSIFSNSMHT